MIDTPTPLIPSHLPREHPLITREYAVFTCAIDDMVTSVAGWLDDQMDGAIIYGPSRYGKCCAVDHWLQRLLSERHGGFVPMVIWSHVDSGGAQSVGRFHAHLLSAAQHPLAHAHRTPAARLHMLIERLTSLAMEGGGRFVVLVIDEAQGMSQREWLWLVQLHSQLEKEQVRLCVISIASVQFFDEPLGLALAGGAHAAARFMLASAPFHGVRDEDELGLVLDGYDLALQWPPDSGISYTEGLAPQAWAAGFRMHQLAPCLMRALQAELPAGYSGPTDYPMKTITQVCRHVLLRLAAGARPEDVGREAVLREIVAASGHRLLMSLVAALGQRQRGVRRSAT